MAKKVLVVDDEDDVLRLVSITLGGDDRYELLLARDGKAALDIARREKPALVLLDIMMRERNGYEVCREIKQDPSTRESRVVMLTALAQDYNRQRGVEVGADDYFTKPFSPTALLDKVGELLGLP